MIALKNEQNRKAPAAGRARARCAATRRVMRCRLLTKQRLSESRGDEAERLLTLVRQCEFVAVPPG